MKKAASICVLALVVSLFHGMAYAKDMAGKIGVGANWLLYFANEVDYDDTDLTSELTPIAFNVHGSYGLPFLTGMLNVNAVVDLEVISRDITVDDADDSDDLGTMTMIPLMVGAQLRYADLGPVVPYVGIGIGVSFNLISEGELADDADIELDAATTFVLKVPVGVDYFVTDNIAVNFEARYFYNNPEVTIENGDEIEDEMDQSTFGIGLGGSFYF